MGWRVWTAWWILLKVIQGYFEHIFKKHETLTDKTPVEIFVKIVQNMVTLKIKSGHCSESLLPEIVKLIEITKEKTTKRKNGENLLHHQNIGVVLVHSNIVDEKYQRVHES